jgi:hypothetical protein
MEKDHGPIFGARFRRMSETFARITLVLFIVWLSIICFFIIIVCFSFSFNVILAFSYVMAIIFDIDLLYQFKNIAHAYFYTYISTVNSTPDYTKLSNFSSRFSALGIYFP